MKRLFPFLLFISILFSSCTGVGKTQYTLGVDSSFTPAVLGGQADHVYGFTVDLVQAIAKIERLNLNCVQTGSESLFSGLQLGAFQGVLSSLFPINAQMKTYSTSDPYFLIGPVLVVPFDSSLNSLSQFNSKIIGTVENSDAFYFVQKYPHIMISTFQSTPFLMEALNYSLVDGVVVSILEAQAFVHNLYLRVFKIASPPLNNEGLRLITLNGAQKDLVMRFNRGLEEIKKRGIYQNLVTKWQLN